MLFASSFGETLMNDTAGPITTYRRYWLPELAVLVLLAVVTIGIFAATDLDLVAQGRFYQPAFPDPWPIAARMPWLLLYRSVSWVTASLAVLGVSLFVAGMVRKGSKHLRLYGAFVLLCVALGPGLVINASLKNHWGRPRPRQIVEFGGRLAYVPPHVPSPTYGRSFPCGHSSIGYLYALGWWIWRRRRPRLAALSLAVGLLTGTLLGIARMAAGAHFLSDVIWSALLVYAVAHVVYYYLLRIPAREDSQGSLYPWLENSTRAKAVTVAVSVLLGLGIILGGLLANPHDADFTWTFRVPEHKPRPETLEVLSDVLDVDIWMVAEPKDEIEFSGSAHGFGLPNGGIDPKWTYAEQPVPAFQYRVLEHGWFTDIDGFLSIRVPVEGLRSVKVRLKRGDINVFDATSGKAGKLPILDLYTANGRVQKK